MVLIQEKIFFLQNSGSGHSRVVLFSRHRKRILIRTAFTITESSSSFDRIYKVEKRIEKIGLLTNKIAGNFREQPKRTCRKKET